ncbi:putative Subtilisin [Georgfuchsia toluolica]|uniref:Subtilisin n=1 Tax=Georgfuchsia toluolica TaxID=424218 RepID=A0A916J705_9PROT|nr:S8 family serine peptidase [Georgfuchsia toluolica]CAG4883581.1 putative Subtilisin [Georgfuchsia toluolica]
MARSFGVYMDIIICSSGMRTHRLASSAETSGTSSARAAARWMLLACLLAAGSARAQLHLPPLQMPTLPLNVPSDIGPASSRATTGLERLDLQGSRLRKNSDLLRRYGGRLEPDPNGNPVIRNEIVAYLPSSALLEKARAEGFNIIRQRALPELDAGTVVLRPKEGVSTLDGLKRLRELAPDDAFDFNHLYGEGGLTTLAGRGAATAPTAAPQAATANLYRRIGLIDGGVDGNVDALRVARIQRDGCRGRTVVSAHGTAVASIMVGRAARFHGAAPGAELYAADVYCAEPTGGSVDAIANAFSWLAGQHVPVINVSLVGPPNRILERIVASMIARGHLIVAAVGNDGPAAAPLYPASYPGVIGVTAVGAAGLVLPEAARGPQVAFAAPGADMVAANIPHGYASVRGTSFAAPVVAGLLALLIDEPGHTTARQALAQLVRGATDLGPPGKDPIYGYGLVGKEIRVAPSQ